MLIIVAAIGKNGELGKDGQLCFKSRADMDLFVKHTKGKTVVMGRKTYESIGHPLEGRENIVITHQDLKDNGVLVAKSLEPFIKDKDHDYYIIGGGRVYRQALPYAELVYLTEFDAEDKEADTFFPVDELHRDFKFAFNEGRASEEMKILFNVYVRKEPIKKSA